MARGIYHETPVAKHDMVLHQDHRGRWRIDLVTSAGGNHIDVTEREAGTVANSGYSSVELAFRSALNIQRKRGIYGKSHVWIADHDGTLTDYEPMEANGRRSGILSDGSRATAYYDDEGAFWTIEVSGIHGSQVLATSSDPSRGVFEDVQEITGQQVPWDVVPVQVKRVAEDSISVMVTNARRKKSVTVADLPASPGNKVLACPECGSEFSALRGDYFLLPKDELLACDHCKVPLQLRSRTMPKPTALDEGAVDDDYVLAIVDRDGAIGLFRVQHGGWQNTDPADHWLPSRPNLRCCGAGCACSRRAECGGLGR